MADHDPLPNPSNLPFIEELYETYLENPEAVSDAWRTYFEDQGDRPGPGARPRLGPSFRPRSLFHAGPGAGGNGRAALAARDIAALQDRADQLIRAYRVRGHLVANLDPLDRPREEQEELDPAFYGFTSDDLERRFSTNTIRGLQRPTLTEILERLRNTYCRSIGVQFMHIDNLAVKNWLTYRMEETENRLSLTKKEQLRILRCLTDAVIFEEFLHKKFLGAKSFSLEGAESLIPLLHLAIEDAVEHGVEKIEIGMAHRGRLNVLRNILRKGPREIFREFDDPDPERNLGQGDVKYHLGFTSEWVTRTRKSAKLSLCFNPSHLEFVNPVAEGRMRALQDRMEDTEREKGLVILVHGDAAFIGEGVVQETLNLSQLPAYTTGGTIHVILNNQIAFTTPPEQSRSTTYASDVAKMLQSPIFHVNGEDPEAVAQVVRLGMEFRRTFHRDVVIDLYGYRRHGHNEGDEPAFTQPVLYRDIERRASTRQGYLRRLMKLGEVTRAEADRIADRQRTLLENELEAARSSQYEYPEEPLGPVWAGYFGGPEKFIPDEDTAVPVEKLSELLLGLTRLPEGFEPHRKIARLLRQRAKMARGEKPLDWAAGEALAMATLAAEGSRVRLTGQDTERGTFSHRHAVLHDRRDGRTYMPLRHLHPDQASVDIYNSPLSEVGVLGFEWGYSLSGPDGLVIWEAQFGDFANVAQVIIDQFIISAEDKWKWFSGLVMLLPHGFEGMGPEHSSARLERYLQLAAEDNIQVVNLTTPAQLFHCLRRQVVRPWRKPLVVMSPKSLLRHPRAVSSLEDLATGEFRRILPDDAADPDGVRRILLCSGKVYYDLRERREEEGREDVAILRVEQLYPLSDQVIEEALSPYADGTDVVWVQEEPENMGAWRAMAVRFWGRIAERFPFRGIYREASASPATGSASSHGREQEMILAEAFEK